MKKFSKVVESNSEQKYKVQLLIEFEVMSANEGEASFIAEDTFKKIDGVVHKSISINRVEKVDIFDESSEKDINI